ncbi:Gfo/Idh/MocA family protein [Flavihumibacter petaseus]|uniref:Putative oxidoreductase n=1 Tax=Flavihumibacter petaseus NBRC 106054 TaxID=1220578 RepID=A0A0E9N581_9BACT|nr:Gfo/Idh/MocA family oxidoreductase [Flavihumibacter petaseus]GAO44500.1 putative oxidoreductase [Flavihumibacter petaseus NBRC 106054]
MSTTGPLRWGILGAGYIAGEFAKDFRFMQHAELVAVAASDIGRAKQFAAQYDIPHAYDYAQLYASPEVDAVYIATTHNFHAEQAAACLRSGKAVLCEKPITINLQEFQLLRNIARENNVFLMEAMWTWFLPALRQAKTWLQEGRIGKLKMIQADFSFAVEYKPQGRLFNRNLAGGSLLDIGIYPIAMATFLTDRYPSAIQSSASFTDTGVDERVGMLLEYGQCLGILSASIGTRMTNHLRIFGETGAIEIPEFWKARTATLFDKEYRQVEVFQDDRPSRGFIFEMQEANDRILSGHKESAVVPLERSLWLQQIMQEVRRQIGLRYPSEV